MANFVISQKGMFECMVPGPKRSGKVRDVYTLGQNRLLIVATDRISTFDCVHPNPIPGKGVILTMLSNFWAQKFTHIVPYHLITDSVKYYPSPYSQFTQELAGRSQLVRKCEVIPFECVVRGFLSGGGWEEYKNSGQICGIRLPSGLLESGKLPEPIFTPATKEVSGHDQNISYDYMAEKIGADLSEKLRQISLTLFALASRYAESVGIIIADTKFEFGLRDSQLFLVDEILTPDNTRFWKNCGYEPGGGQESLDKQYVRDFVINNGWSKNPPAPELPQDVVANTQIKYAEIFKILTGDEITLSGEALKYG